MRLRFPIAAAALAGLLGGGAPTPAAAGEPTVDPAGAVPTDLDGLVRLAVARHPEVQALARDAAAARQRTTGAGRLADPEWMLAGQSLGAMAGSMDPTMFMVGVQQTIGVPGTYGAARARAGLDVAWSEGEEARVVADTREGLWQAAARLRAWADTARLLDEQVALAETALAFGRARYVAGGPAAVAQPMTAIRGSGAVSAAPQVPQPTRGPMSSGTPAAMPGMASPGAGSMASGMAGMAGATSTSSTSMSGMAPSSTGMAMGPAPMPGGAMAGAMGGDGLAGLLRLDTERARIVAERSGLAARRASEVARLGLIVGPDAAAAVDREPARFLGPRAGDAAVNAPGGPKPERAQPAAPEQALATTSAAMAEADLRLTRTARAPMFMAMADVQVMPDGMVNGVDAQLGVTVPVWGGSRARVEAAESAVAAAALRADDVDRGLADAILAAQAEAAEAGARADALRADARPQAEAAWALSLAAWESGVGSSGELVAAWQARLAVERERVDAELAVELARARIARLGGT